MQFVQDHAIHIVIQAEHTYVDRNTPAQTANVIAIQSNVVLFQLQATNPANQGTFTATKPAAAVQGTFGQAVAGSTTLFAMGAIPFAAAFDVTSQ